MGILWLNLVVVYISSFFARYFAKPVDMKVPYIKPNRLLLFVSITSLILVAGLRNNIGDTFFYMHSYQVENFHLNNILFKGDFGFNVFQSILHQFSNDPQILVFTTAFITNLLISIILFKYSRMIELSFFVYIAAGMYTVSMNGIRQALAAAIIFAATKYILNGDWKKFIIVTLLTSTIHQTALIFIPIYFIIRRPAWTKVTLILVLVGVGIAAGFSIFSDLLFKAIQDTQYGHYSDISERGANVIRVAVTAVPLLIAFLGRERLKELWPKSDYIVNLSLIGFIFMIISTKNWIFARFDIYFSLFNLILISWIVSLLKEKDRKFLYFCLIICYLIYFYYEQVVSLNIVYESSYI